ncbi:ATP-binding protein [Spiroplasma endosymbiont of Polydrusus pterygomalis]|uniref:ATP-binding protein n=1 Tax=Spiroplasma endosymbiont of Polydrusus pterygomalis TaxID=3139327 RepID=UPI003CCB2316
MKLKATTILKENINNAEFHDFIKKNNLTNSKLEPYVELLKNYISSYNLCKKRENLNKCEQNVKGYRYKLVMLPNKKISLVLTDCLHSINRSIQKQVHNNFLIKYYDDKLLSLSWSKNFNASTNARKQIIQYLHHSLKHKSYQGLYLYGETGSGKTFIFILFANKLIQKNQTVCFIVWPEFVMDIKKSFKNDTDSNQQIEQLKACDLLFIDDLGGETISAWERDELLFSILNARILPLKTTFINSNYSISELYQHYYLRNNKSEEIKVKRLLERIQTLTVPIELTVEEAEKIGEKNNINIENSNDEEREYSIVNN